MATRVVCRRFVEAVGLLLRLERVELQGERVLRLAGSVECRLGTLSAGGFVRVVLGQARLAPRCERTCWAIRLASARAARAASACLAQASAVAELSPLLVEGFLCGVREVGFELALDEVGFGLRGRASLVRELLHALVDGEAQEGDQDLAALLGLAFQERVELALREDDGAGEPVVVEAEDEVHLVADLSHAVGKRLGAAGRDALEALLGGLVGAGGARDAVAVLADSELEHDERRFCRG